MSGFGIKRIICDRAAHLHKIHLPTKPNDPSVMNVNVQTLKPYGRILLIMEGYYGGKIKKLAEMIKHQVNKKKRLAWSLTYQAKG